MSFQPKYRITTGIAKDLMAIEAVKQSIVRLPITPKVLANLHRTARLSATHFSTQIEGNRLSAQEVKEVLDALKGCLQPPHTRTKTPRSVLSSAM